MGGRGEGPEDLAVGACNAGKGEARGETRGKRAAHVDDAKADCRAAGENALVHVEERAPGAAKLQANFAGKGRARGQLEPRAEERRERDRVGRDGVDLADPARERKDGWVRCVREEVTRRRGYETRGR